MQITGRLIYSLRQNYIIDDMTRRRIVLKKAKISGIEKKLYGYHYQISNGIFWTSLVCHTVFSDDSSDFIEKARNYMERKFIYNYL